MRREILKQMLNLSTAGFGLVAALAWNNVIQEFVNSYIKRWIPGGAGIISLIIYAVVMTIMAVVITYNLSQVLQEEKDKGKKKK